MPGFRVARIEVHGSLLEPARKDAQLILARDPDADLRARRSAAPPALSVRARRGDPAAACGVSVSDRTGVAGKNSAFLATAFVLIAARRRCDDPAVSPPPHGTDLRKGLPSRQSRRGRRRTRCASPVSVEPRHETLEPVRHRRAPWAAIAPRPAARQRGAGAVELFQQQPACADIRRRAPAARSAAARARRDLGQQFVDRLGHRVQVIVEQVVVCAVGDVIQRPPAICRCACCRSGWRRGNAVGRSRN